MQSSHLVSYASDSANFWIIRPEIAEYPSNTFQSKPFAQFINLLLIFILLQFDRTFSLNYLEGFPFIKATFKINTAKKVMQSKLYLGKSPKSRKDRIYALIYSR